MYEPQGLALEIFQSRHGAHAAETWQEGCRRVALHVAEAEGNVGSWAESFEHLLLSNEFMPGGRIWYGSGRPRGQLMNCFVTSTSDSREGWGRTVSNSIVISGTGGGVGINCSPVRPRGQVVRGTGGHATGAVSLMEIINAAGEVIKAGGGRRTALMLALDITHGDLPEFLDAKLDKKRLNNANVSIWFGEDPKRFLDAVEHDAEWVLTHQSREVGRVRARSLWEKIVENMLAGGEPGLLNGYLANQLSNIWYREQLICTNPCGEQMLADDDACCLGAVVLPRFVVGGRVQWERLRDAVTMGVRFLDDVLTVNHYPLPSIAAKCAELRRIGLGITGLHHMLLELGLTYDGVDGLEFVDKLMKFIKHASYDASAALGLEKGSFPAYDAPKFAKSGFAKTLKPSTRERASRAMRNCSVNTIAPTGTTSMVCDTSSGIEPIFAPAHERRFRRGEELAVEVVIDPMVRRFLAEGRDVSHFRGAHEISVRHHLEMQRTCQRHVDNAVSKTINVPRGTTPAELAELLAEYLPELKGVTVYPDGSREDQPLTPIPLIDALARESVTGTTENGCAGGACDL